MFGLNSFDSFLNPPTQPSFIMDSQIWQSIDSGETQDRSAWENGYVLTDNLDGTITAQPKNTAGIPPLTLRKVPIMTENTKNFESPTLAPANLGPGGTQQTPAFVVAQPNKDTLSSNNETFISTDSLFLPLVVGAITIVAISTGLIIGDSKWYNKHRN